MRRMKVLDLRCAQDHRFEGWFASDEDEASQRERGLLACPLCGDDDVQRLPSAPRLNLCAARATETLALPAPDDLQAQWLRAVRTGDGPHRGCRRTLPRGGAPHPLRRGAARGIRGQASPTTPRRSREEGIEVMSLPVPAALKGSIQ